MTPDLRPKFAERYGPWGLIAGASEGIGAAFARALDRRGVSLVLLARRLGPLEALADELRALGVEIRTLPFDLGSESIESEGNEWHHPTAIHYLKERPCENPFSIPTPSTSVR